MLLWELEESAVAVSVFDSVNDDDSVEESAGDGLNVVSCVNVKDLDRVGPSFEMDALEDRLSDFSFVGVTVELRDTSFDKEAEIESDDDTSGVTLDDAVDVFRVGDRAMLELRVDEGSALSVELSSMVMVAELLSEPVEESDTDQLFDGLSEAEPLGSLVGVIECSSDSVFTVTLNVGDLVLVRPDVSVDDCDLVRDRSSEKVKVDERECD